MNAHAAHRQSAMYVTGAALTPANPDLLPFQVQIRATYTDFFAMFDDAVPDGRRRGARPTTRITPTSW